MAEKANPQKVPLWRSELFLGTIYPLLGGVIIAILVAVVMRYAG